MQEVQLSLSAFAEEGKITVYIDAETLLEGSGRAEKELQTGKTYTLRWKVVGPRNTVYRISLSAPVSMSFSLFKTLGANGQDEGKHLIEL